MFGLDRLGALADSKHAWGWLFFSALGLELTALYFQYGMGLEPCIMCIYQRTAVFGVMLAGLVPWLANNFITRVVGFVTWGVSAIWGLLIAIEHVDIQTATNPFFASCEIVPNFPAFMPLHEWVPQMFAATGDCGDIDWQFLTLSMPQWMIVIFAIYSALFGGVLLSRLLVRKAL
ncbi:disulfide bond formation protein DsbB [Aestuariibacter halophilus]|uniref:Disulfide bond formation protein B n=1 Tax=Fluctibacter halophilus TaxID=226011 RepID=A0ABS8G957_9ALTE|nr:disulfide bond formation protein DsbB [Aestuariibacter halophilus]MCC2616254.1 disulfide bond formation protein DsbB [Aestuariibacter halophilus]